jgi:hypothetical protein
MLATFILEEKGSFRRFIHQLSNAGIARGVSKRSITEFKYRSVDTSNPHRNNTKSGTNTLAPNPKPWTLVENTRNRAQPP